MEFEWDNNKEIANLKKHGISFVTAAKLLLTVHYVARSDRQNEIRYLAIGELESHVLAVVYTKREDRFRIISARKASTYEEKTFKKYSELSCSGFASGQKN